MFTAQVSALIERVEASHGRSVRKALRELREFSSLDVEEAVQDALLSIARNCVEPHVALRPGWLYAVSRRLLVYAWTKRRRRWRAERPFSSFEAESNRAEEMRALVTRLGGWLEPDEHSTPSSRLAALRAASALKPLSREYEELHVLCGLPDSRIARERGVLPESVRSCRKRFRKTVRTLAA